MGSSFQLNSMTVINQAPGNQLGLDWWHAAQGDAFLMKIYSLFTSYSVDIVGSCRPSHLPQELRGPADIRYVAGCPATSFFSYYFLFSPLFHTTSYFFLFFSSNLLLTPIFWGMQKKKKKCISKNKHLPHNMCFMIIACAYKQFKIIFNGYDHSLR